MTFYIQMRNYCTHFFHFSTGILYYCWYHLRNDSRSDEEVLLQNAVRGGVTSHLPESAAHPTHPSPAGSEDWNRQISYKERVQYWNLQWKTHQQIQEDTDVANKSVPPLKNKEFRKLSGFRLVGGKRQIQHSLYSRPSWAKRSASTSLLRKKKHLAEMKPYTWEVSLALHIGRLGAYSGLLLFENLTIWYVGWFSVVSARFTAPQGKQCWNQKILLWSASGQISHFQFSFSFSYVLLF